LNNDLDPTESQLMMNFKQILHLQETKDNIQNILLNNFMIIKV